MTKILTVEDSRAQRAIIARALAGRGYEICEAEDGQQGLDELEVNPVDLVLLDVTMPVMDGPTMLSKLRARGDQTPVILLTAESKMSIIAEMIQEGVDDYILKPFKADQLLSKVDKILGPPTQSAKVEDSPVGFTGKPLEDILVVDDMDNVAKRLKRLLPAHMKMSSCLDASGALDLGRERLFRCLLIDLEIPDVDTQQLISQLQALQPNAALVLLVMRNMENKGLRAKQLGCNSFLAKPFNQDELDKFLSDYFESRNYIDVEGNVVSVSAWAGRNKQFTDGYRKITELVTAELDKAAAACFDAMVLDLTTVEDSPAIIKVLVKTQEHAIDMGVELRVVMEGSKINGLKAFKETENIPVFGSLGAAIDAG